MLFHSFFSASWQDCLLTLSSLPVLSLFVAPQIFFSLRMLSGRKGTALIKSKALEQAGSLGIPGDCGNEVKHFPCARRGKATNPLLWTIWMGIMDGQLFVTYMVLSFLKKHTYTCRRSKLCSTICRQITTHT